MPGEYTEYLAAGPYGNSSPFMEANSGQMTVCPVAREWICRAFLQGYRFKVSVLQKPCHHGLSHLQVDGLCQPQQ